MKFQINIDCPHEVIDQPQSTGVAPVSLLSTVATTDLLPTPILTTPTNTSLLEPLHIAILTGLNTHTPHVDVDH